jgi:uncharacterized membrane protein HdeD (DUF308 family)
MGISKTFYRISIVRGSLAVMLGILLVLNRGEQLPTLANFMGMYWLASGIVSLRWGLEATGERRIAVVAGVVGILAGTFMLLRRFFAQYVGDSLGVTLIGLVILLTGLLHMVGGYRSRETPERIQTLGSFLLGVFEVVLGLLLIVVPTIERGSALYLTASVWSFLGGAVLISDALWIRRQLQHIS